DPDQQDDADQGDHAEVCPAEQQRQDRPHPGRGQRRENREGVDVALVEHAEDDVDGDQRGEDEQRLVGERGLEGLRGALEARADAGGEAEVAHGGFDGGDGGDEGDAVGQVEGEGDGGELALVVDGEGGGGGTEVGEGGERHGHAGGRAHVDVLEGLRALPERRGDLHHDVVLVQLGVHGRD